jgi:hypothetical protein
MHNKPLKFKTQIDENTKLKAMRAVQDRLTSTITKVIRNNELIYVFGDLQDTPDNSKMFHYGSSRIPKHVNHSISNARFITTVTHWKNQLFLDTDQKEADLSMVCIHRKKALPILWELRLYRIPVSSPTMI